MPRPRSFDPALVLACSLGLALLSLGPAGCRTSPGPGDERVLRVTNTGSVDFDDLSGELAHELLRERGYRVDTTTYRLSSLAAEALARGDADIGVGAMPVYLKALSMGAPIRLIGEHVANPHRLVARRGVSCAELGTEGIASQGEGAATTILARAWLSESCPEHPARFVFVQQSENRLAALMSGRIAASVLKMPELVKLDQLAPDRFSVMADFSRTWPELIVVGLFANARWAEQHEEVVELYLQARQEAAERLATADALVELAARTLGPSNDWAVVTRMYLDIGAWNALIPSAARLERTLDFFGRHAGIDGLEADAVTGLQAAWQDK